MGGVVKQADCGYNLTRWSGWWWSVPTSLCRLHTFMRKLSTCHTWGEVPNTGMQEGSPWSQSEEAGSWRRWGVAGDRGKTERISLFQTLIQSAREGVTQGVGKRV